MVRQQNSPNHILIAQEGPSRGCSVSKIGVRRLLTAVALSSLLLSVPSLTAPAFADSQARVVRLSEVQGDVKIDRNLGQGYEKAFLNLPIMQGEKLQTKSDGRAEVEFEDGSTLRITPDTVIEFPQLSLRDSGAKVSAVHLQEGIAYVNFAGAKGDEFTLTFAHEKIAIAQAAHLRLEVADVTATVAAFKGDVRVEGDSGTVAVSKNRTATFDLTNGDRSTLAKDVEPDPFDAWDKQQDQYHQQYGSNTYRSYSPYAYGTSDLNYYGNFFNAPGYGTVWQPYFAGAGWDPYMNGAWAFSPGFGYGWVSGYPWGWTPYHYGSWAYLPTYGWAWQPGGTWAGYSGPRIIRPPANFVSPQPPSSSVQEIVPVNRGPVPVQVGRSFNRLEISQNSAGLGIPRGGIKNLNQLSSTVQQQGFATAKVHTAALGTNSSRAGNYAPASQMGAWHGGGAPSASAGHSSSGHSSRH
jgi:FecR protein